MESKCDDFKLKIQGLADGELDLTDESSSDLFLHLSSCRECREEYHSLMNVKNRIKIEGSKQPSKELFIEFEKRRSSSVIRKIGYLLILVPYIIIVGIGMYELFRDGSEGLLIKSSFLAIITGIIILLIYTIKGRIKESKNDKYKEIIR